MNHLIKVRYPSAVFYDLLKACNGHCVLENASLVNDGHEYDSTFMVPVDSHAEFVTALSKHEGSITDIIGQTETPKLAAVKVKAETIRKVKKAKGKRSRKGTAASNRKGTAASKLRALLTGKALTLDELEAKTGWKRPVIQGRMVMFRRNKTLKIKETPEGKTYSLAA